MNSLRIYTRSYVQEQIRRYTVGSARLLGVAIILVLCSTHFAHAEGLFGFPSLWDFMAEGTAFLVNIALAITSWFVALTGTLLNVSINLTMHIRDFVDSTPAIYQVWKTIRDISGLFIIFALLYAAIRMIVGLDAGLKGVIKNIVIAGVVINFSFFIAGILIDASNVVSLQLYKAITPGQPDIGQIIRNEQAGSLAGGGGAMLQVVTTLFNDGGLSAIFMQSLQIQSVFHPKNLDLANADNSTGISTPFKIILIGTTGVVIMITAGLSFLFAALAFVVRLVLLLFLLAFSPIWCAAYVVPKLQEYANEWWKVFTNQLVFMPVYLLLMYAALLILTKSNIFNAGSYGNLWQGVQTTGVPTEYIAFAINAVFVIIMLNIPLLAAIKLGASTAKLLDGNNFSAKAIWNKTRGIAYQGTISRGASAVARSEGLKNWASKSFVGEMAYKGIKGTAKDYDAKLAAQVKGKTEFAEGLGYNQELVRKQQAAIRKTESELASGAISKAAAKVRIDAAEQAIEDIKNNRKMEYVNRTEVGQPDTLWLKVARKNKVAAAKIQGSIYKKRVEEAKKALDKIREKIKNTEESMEKLQEQIDTGSAKNPAKTLNKKILLGTKIPGMRTEENAAIKELGRLEDILAPYENVS